MEAREGAVWLCNACGRTDKDRGALYARGCGTWAVEVLEESIVRDPVLGLVTKATLVADIEHLEITAKVVV